MIEKTRLDDVRLLTLLHKPTHFQFALPIKDGSCKSVQDALKLLQDILERSQAMRRIFSLVFTDNGGEFSDEDALAKLFGEQKGKVGFFCCKTRRADQNIGKKYRNLPPSDIRSERPSRQPHKRIAARQLPYTTTLLVHSTSSS